MNAYEWVNEVDLRVFDEFIEVELAFVGQSCKIGENLAKKHHCVVEFAFCFQTSLSKKFSQNNFVKYTVLCY